MEYRAQLTHQVLGLGSREEHLCDGMTAVVIQRYAFVVLFDSMNASCRHGVRHLIAHKFSIACETARKQQSGNLFSAHFTFKHVWTFHISD
jgi:hypothetical protein